MRHELMCLSKVLGHPFVAMKEGSRSLFQSTNERLEIDMRKVLRCIDYFKRDYIKKHIHKFKKWPPARLTPPHTPKGLAMAFIHNVDPDNLQNIAKHGATDISDYIYVELLPNMQFHKLENIIPHLKDKTISLLRSDVISYYFEYLEVEDQWQKTHILTYLLAPTIIHDHVKYLEKFTYTDDLESLMNYLVIRIVPKEKELKVIYRGFGCKTYEDRHRSLAQEKNVMMFLDQYSDEHSMTISELSILKKMDSLRRMLGAYKGYKVLYIVIDASKWNNKFRHETVDVMMKQTLDKIFHYPIFSKTHMAFRNTLMYVPDEVATYYWEGQDGGIEGLNQDTWVVVYLSQIKVAMEGFPLQYYVLCKGDDLRLAVLIPEKSDYADSILTTKNLIVSRISETAKGFGHTINIEESYGSSRYFAFSKSASLDRVEMQQTLRKIQKCHGANNDTLDNYIGSTFSNAHGACKTHPIVVPCYSVGVFWALCYLIRSPIFKSCTESELVALCLITICVGGFPIIYLHNMHVRAESDLLSPFLGLVSYTQTRYPEISRAMQSFCFTTRVIPKSFIGIYSDPYSLPLLRPPLPDVALRNYILPTLERLTKNKDVKELITASKSVQNTNIIRALDSCNVIRAMVMSVIFSATPQGVLQELLKKFETGQSVLQLLLMRFRRPIAHRIILKIVQYEKRLQTWRFQVITGKKRLDGRPFFHLIENCPSISANNVREYCWGKPVEDVTMPPLQHQLELYPAALDAISAFIIMMTLHYLLGVVLSTMRMVLDLLSLDTRHRLVLKHPQSILLKRMF